MKFTPKMTSTEPAEAAGAATVDIELHDAADDITTSPTRSVPRKAVIVAVAAVASFTAGFAVSTFTTPQHAMVTNAGAGEESASLEPAITADALVRNAISTAAEYHSTRGTYIGFTTPSVMVATSASTILFAATIDGVCAFSKVVDGVPYEVGIDATGDTCTGSTMNAAQGVLDDLAASTESSGMVALGASVRAVADAAVLYASLSFDAAGRPSLYGLTNLPVPDSKVVAVSRDGQTATVQVIADGSCAYIEVSATANPAPPVSKC